MCSREKLKLIAQYLLRGLPVVGVIVSTFLPIRKSLQPWLILITLVWLQTFLLGEVFSINK